MKKRWAIVAVLVLTLAALVFLGVDSRKIGVQIDSYKGVPVFYNGIVFFKSHGKNFGPDNYYYGQKWQCVEFIKRFYFQAKNHKMPEVMGHARSYFDQSVPQGGINVQRGLAQFRNGGNVSPAVDDLIVFTSTKYGHVAIVSGVTENEIEVVQQNIYGKPRQRFQLRAVNGNYFVSNPREPAGWLRLKNPQ